MDGLADGFQKLNHYELMHGTSGVAARSGRKQMADETVHDVVIVGSGAAGLGCAVAAQSLGLDCVVIEKAAALGGGTAISGGFLWIGANHLNAQAGGRDTAEEVEAYLRYVGATGIDEERMHALAEHAPATLRFFESCGIPFQLTGRLDHFHGVAPGATSGERIVEAAPIAAADLSEPGFPVALPAGALFRLGGNEAIQLGGPNRQATWDAALAPDRAARDLRGGGAGLVTWLMRLAMARDVAIVAGVRAERLLVDDGRVAGVAAADGRTFRARRGVVLATGGYESNPEMVGAFESLPGFQSMFPETLTGDGMVMATEIGAAVQVIPNNHSVFLGFRNPDEAPGGTAVCRLSGNVELPARHTIVVNRFGRRFADETFFQAIGPSLHTFDMQLREQANLPCFLIFDQQVRAGKFFRGTSAWRRDSRLGAIRRHVGRSRRGGRRRSVRTGDNGGAI